MSQEKKDTCPSCGKAWLTHHAFIDFADDGGPNVRCSNEPVLPTDPVLKYILAVNVEMDLLRGKIETLEKDVEIAESQRQTDAAELIRRHETTLATEIAKKVEEARVDLESTRVMLKGEYDAKHLTLQGRLDEALGENKVLAAQKAELERKLGESEAEVIDLGLKIDELKADLGRHVELKEKILKLVTDEGKPAATAAAPASVPTTPSAKPTASPAPKPTTVAPSAAPAPQAAAAPKPTSVRMPVQTLSTFAKPAPAADADDDDDDLDDHPVDADDIEDEQSDDSECDGCANPPKKVMYFISKGGAKDRILSCGDSTHDKAFLQHLQQEAKNAPADVTEMQKKFNPIEGGTP